MFFNHPVHLKNANNQVSSAFIPFCAFGGKFLGQKIHNLTIPVCNSFQPTLLNDQMCYEIELNNMTNKKTVKEDIKAGFVFIMDYNEDRQVTFNKAQRSKDDFSFVKTIDKSDDNQHAFIYLNTRGTCFNNFYQMIY